MKKRQKHKKNKNKINSFNNPSQNENINSINNLSQPSKKEESKNDQPSPKKKSNINKLEDKFKKKLHSLNYILHIVPSDGNCIFSSISDQVYGTDKHNLIIREKCMDYIEKNSVYYSQFIEGGEKQMSAYIERKRKKGIWGDNLEIQALSEIYKRPIEIYIEPGKPISTLNDNKFGNNRFPIKISYHGNKHYNSIVPSVKSGDFPFFKNELINTVPGIYETQFIINFDPNIKFNEMFYNFTENNIDLDAIIQENISKDEEFLINEAIEESKNNININNINNNETMKKEKEEEYLKNPIIQNALEFGFDLSEAIEALKICGQNDEMVINYLYDKKK